MVLPPKPKSGSQITVPAKNPVSQSVAATVSHKEIVTAEEPVVLDVLPASTGVEASGASGRIEVSSQSKRFPFNLVDKLDLVLGQNNKAYVIFKDSGNYYIIAVGSRKMDNIIRQHALKEGVILRKSDLKETNEYLQAHTEISGKFKDVFYRVALTEDGIEIDLGDEHQTRAKITTVGKVEIIREGSKTLFYRTQLSRPFAVPSQHGNLDLLKKYLNLGPIDVLLFIAWLSYTLALAKVSTSKFVILVLNGGHGTGKTSLCNLILKLIDPNIAGVQVMPSNSKDLAISAQNAHVLCYDNIRGFKQAMSDALCIAATGGTLSTRQLYTDDEQHVKTLHVGLVLNGIHDFVKESDLAQRSLPIHLREIDEANRKSEAQLDNELQQDLPAILRGLFNLIADIFKQLPHAKVTHPERMIDFVHWLAAMEKVDGAPAGIYQQEYSESLRQAQLDSLLENTLAAAIIEFTEEIKHSWTGTPSALLGELNCTVTMGVQRSRFWPQNSIALSKRLQSLQADLKSQGIEITFGRGKHRNITITNLEAY